MKMKQIQEIVYEYGDEDRIIRLLYQAKEPILIKIKNFTDKFTLDYFAALEQTTTAYDVFDKGRWVAYQKDDLATALAKIKQNMPYRIFGQFFSPEQTAVIENYVPLWQKIPFRPRFFNELIKVGFFFGGKGSRTDIHFDREHCCNLHICLSGKKRVLLFTEDQSDCIYKVPFIGDSLIDFSQPLDAISKQFPRINDAEAYDVIIEQGDMVFMPKNCWHYTEYLEAAASATYVFYPKKIHQFYGYFTGYFFLGYAAETGFKISKWPIFQKFAQQYALASGLRKYGYKFLEKTLYFFMLPICSIGQAIAHKLRVRQYKRDQT